MSPQPAAWLTARSNLARSTSFMSRCSNRSRVGARAAGLLDVLGGDVHAERVRSRSARQLHEQRALAAAHLHDPGAGGQVEQLYHLVEPLARAG